MCTGKKITTKNAIIIILGLMFEALGIDALTSSCGWREVSRLRRSLDAWSEIFRVSGERAGVVLAGAE